jgi:hypothetical protein
VTVTSIIEIITDGNVVSGATLNFIGELAAVLTSISWSGTSVLFTKATQQVGSIIVNRIRVILALVFLMLLNWAFYGLFAACQCRGGPLGLVCALGRDRLCPGRCLPVPELSVSRHTTRNADDEPGSPC